MNEADKEVRTVIGDLMIANIVLKHRIAELEAENAALREAVEAPEQDE